MSINRTSEPSDAFVKRIDLFVQLCQLPLQVEKGLQRWPTSVLGKYGRLYRQSYDRPPERKTKGLRKGHERKG